MRRDVKRKIPRGFATSVVVLLLSATFLSVASFALFSLPSVLGAATFTCAFKEACAEGETGLLRAENDTGGYENAHAQLMNYSGDAYAYTLCCDTDASHTLNNSCANESTTVILRASATSDAHVQDPAVDTYAYGICMAATPGGVTCEYVNDSCSANYNPILSMASSEENDGSNNQTNAHISNYSSYLLSVCCAIGNDAPNDPSPEINSTDGTNDDGQDLNCFDTITDAEGEAMNVSVQWYKNGALAYWGNYTGSYASGSFFTATLDEANTTKDDVWLCSMRLYDGTSYSSWVNSSSLTIVGCHPPSGAGDWEVNGTEVCRDRSIDITGNLQIRSGDRLIFDNVDFQVECGATTSLYDLYLQNGGYWLIANGSTIGEKGGNAYYFAYLYNGNLTMTDSSVNGNELYYFRTLGSSIVNITNSTIYQFLHEYDGAIVSLTDVKIGSYLMLYILAGSNVTIDGLNDSASLVNYDISSSNTAMQLNLMDVNFTTTAKMQIINNGGTLTVNNSRVYYILHFDDANDNTTVVNTTTTYMALYGESGQCLVDGINPPNTRSTATNLTTTIACTNNEFVLDNVGVTYFSVFVNAAPARMNISDSVLLYIYGYAGVANITNTNSTRLLCYGTGKVFTNGLRTSTITQFSNTCKANITNSYFASTSYTRIYDTAVVNFTTPYSSVDDLELSSGTHAPTIYGYVNFTVPIDSWGAGNKLNRYLPFNVTNNGAPIEDANVTVYDGVTLRNTGLTGADGIVTLNISDDNSANPAKEYQVFLNGVNRVNITLLVNSAPTGVQLGNSTPTVPVLSYPLDGNDTVFERTISFDWLPSTDADGDPITYDFNLSQATCAGDYQEDLAASAYTSGELCVDKLYNWTVRACDDKGACSDWATVFTFTIASTEGITFTVNNTDFGLVARGGTNDTTDDAPPPLTLENTGNVPLNVTFKALDPLFTTSGLGNTTFRYKAREDEAGAYDAAQTAWANVDGVYTALLTNFSYASAADSVFVDLLISSPYDEPAGGKSSTLQVLGEYTG